MLHLLLVESNLLNQCRREMFFLPGHPIDTGLMLKGPPCLNKDDLT